MAGFGRNDDDKASRRELNQRLFLRYRGDPRLEGIVEDAARHYAVTCAAISLIDHKQELIVCHVGDHMPPADRSESFCATTVQRPGHVLVVPDAQTNTQFAHFKSVTGPPFIRFYAGACLMSRSGYALGALCVADTRPAQSRFDPLHLTMLALKAETIIVH